MLWKSLLIACIGAGASIALASANSVDDCNARLVTNLYYGAFKSCLKSGKFTNAHLDAAIASDLPINPVEGETRTVKNGAAKDTFENLVNDPVVIKLWKQTRDLLRGLRIEHDGLEETREKAEFATRKVLDPHVHLQIESDSSSVSFFKLPDGRGVIAHMLGNAKLVVTDLANKEEIFAEDVPEVVREGNINLVNWYQTKRGELWLYVSSYSVDHGSKIFKLKWGERKFKEINLQLPTNQVLTNAFSPTPGLQVVRVEGGLFKEQYFNIASGKPQSVLWMKGHSPGDWIFDEDKKEITPSSARGFHVSKVFASTGGPVQVKAGYSKIEIERNGKPTQNLTPPGGDGVPADATFFESEPGKEYLAIEYTRTKQDRHILFWDLNASPNPIDDFTVEAQTFASYFWFRHRGGAPFLGMQAHQKGVFSFVVVDPLGRDVVLKQKVPGYIANWIKHGEEIYFSTHTSAGNFVFKLDREQGKPQIP